MTLDIPKYNELFKQKDVRETTSDKALSTDTFVTFSANSDLTKERVLTAGEGIDLTDGGANTTLTISGEDTSTTNKGIIEIATEDEVQTGTDTARAVTPDTLQSVLMPIGAIVSWLKSYASTPATLPTGWVECDGAVLSDADSVYDGQTLPDLNGDNRFLRGNSTSGGTGGSSTHTLTIAEMPNHEHSEAVDGNLVYKGSGSSPKITKTNTGNNSTIEVTSWKGGNGAHENKPPYYNVVWIMRIK